ncbi:EAL domain-containing protein [Hafnia paralvei]|uniref:EAL domain-containing protein n=1 Tax=Hafnia paralvei TaxID=546367 RepID=UPI001CCFA23E|nr:EAL domain-containing protein [Hafnia paralvei]UBM40177.1 EAL domain-containing protein [Hafnia paralvei]
MKPPSAKKNIFLSFFLGLILTFILNATMTWFSLLHQAKNELMALSQETMYTIEGYLSEAKVLLDKTIQRAPQDCSLKSREVFIPDLLSAVIVTDILYTLPDKTVCSLTYGDTIHTALPQHPITEWNGMQIYLLAESELAAGRGNVLIGENGVFALLPYQQLTRFYFINGVPQPQLRIMANNEVLAYTANTTLQDNLWFVVGKNAVDGLQVEYTIPYTLLYSYWLKTFWPTQWAINILSFLLFCLLFSIYIKHQLAMKTAIQRALKKEGFCLYYQPIVNINTGKIQSLEALIRWPTASGGTIPADTFIAIAEDTGLICKITKYVLHQAIIDLSKLHQTHPELIVAVNISAADLSSPKFVTQLRTLCADYALSPHYLKLEITERNLVRDETAKYNMKRLNEEGFGLVLDDFGTGYSSLSYLNKLPVQTLKIDRSFIMGLGLNIATESVVPHIVSMAQQLNMTIIAEGVETEDQVKALLNLQVPYAQGWFYDKAMPLVDIHKKLLINNHHPYR